MTPAGSLGTKKTVQVGSVEHILPTLEANSFDGCLTDPPYGISFMGKSWDHGVPSADVWREVLRVLKPGAHMLAFGGTRTFHRLTCAIEDAGFEIRDCLMWLYGSGFPKSMDIGKAIDKAAGVQREVVGQKLGKSGENLNMLARPSGDDSPSAKGCGAYGQGAKQTSISIPITAPATEGAKRWDGYGTALKPSWEPIILAMKPTDGTFAANALKHGVAGLNIAAGRIEAGTRPLVVADRGRMTGNSWEGGLDGSLCGSRAQGTTGLGRWPANLLLDEDAAALLDAQSGELGRSAGGGMNRDSKRASSYAPGHNKVEAVGFGDSGGASRFFYVAKASTRERGEGNTHPTVKPQRLTAELAAYLLALIQPPERDTPRRLLVPYSGSGSEMLGAERAGWEYVLGIEQNAEYAAIASRRLSA